MIKFLISAKARIEPQSSAQPYRTHHMTLPPMSSRAPLFWGARRSLPQGRDCFDQKTRLVSQWHPDECVHLHQTRRNARGSFIRPLGVLRALAVKNVSLNRGDAKDAKRGRGNVPSQCGGTGKPHPCPYRAARWLCCRIRQEWIEPACINTVGASGPAP